MTTPSPISPEAERHINETIARWLGWNWTLYNGRAVLFPPSLWEDNPAQQVINPDEYPNLEKLSLSVPRFTRSLDALALAEARLSDEQHHYYRSILKADTNTCDGKVIFGDDVDGEREYISASALDRSRALVKILESSAK